MQKTTYQRPEIRDSNNTVIQSGAYGKNTSFCNQQNTGILDYVNNNLEFLYDNLPKFYTSISQLGLSYPCTMVNILTATPNNSLVILNVEAKSTTITDAPASYGILTIKRGDQIARTDIEFKQSSTTGGINRYYASFVTSTNAFTWYKYSATVV